MTSWQEADCKPVLGKKNGYSVCEAARLVSASACELSHFDSRISCVGAKLRSIVGVAAAEMSEESGSASHAQRAGSCY